MPEYFEKYGRKEPQTTNHVPMSYAYGKPDLSFYELLAEDEAWVGSFLKGMAHVESRMPVTAGIYDFSWLVAEARARPDSDRAVLVDVGGGKGGAIRAIHREFPALPIHRFVLEDRPETIEAGLALLGEDDELAGVRRVALDFHKDQPVKGALWGHCLRLLRNSTNLVGTQGLTRTGCAAASTTTPTTCPRTCCGLLWMPWLMIAGCSSRRMSWTTHLISGRHTLTS